MKKILTAFFLLAIVAHTLAAPDSETSAKPLSATVYHGNVNTKKFHKKSCRYFDCEACTRVFYTREEAIKAEYIPCKICKP